MSPVLLADVNPPRAAELAQLIRLHTALAETWAANLIQAATDGDPSLVQAISTSVIAETSLVAMYRAELNSLGH